MEGITETNSGAASTADVATQEHAQSMDTGSFFDGNKSVPISAFLPLAEIPNVRLYSLQKGPRFSELKENGAESCIEDIGSLCEDFADTAVAIENLDLIVMTDSSVAHLAASLNKPVINLIQKVPYWLYTFDGERTPWYPSMRLLRLDMQGK